MQKYDYRAAMQADIREYLRDNYSENLENEKENYSKEEFEEKLNDELWIEDCVTGNASGSYTFSAYEAEENLCHNWDLLADAIEEFGGNTDILRRGPEVCDVTIRCYLLGEAISEVLDELWD